MNFLSMHSISFYKSILIQIITRKSNFAKVNTDALFKAVDVDNSGTITEDEWMEFWNSVKRSGYSEEEIEEEVILIN